MEEWERKLRDKLDKEIPYLDGRLFTVEHGNNIKVHWTKQGLINFRVACAAMAIQGNERNRALWDIPEKETLPYWDGYIKKYTDEHPDTIRKDRLRISARGTGKSLWQQAAASMEIPKGIGLLEQIKQYEASMKEHWAAEMEKCKDPEYFFKHYWKLK
jgi:hypothetical protein